MSKKIKTHLYYVRRIGLLTEIKTEINHTLMHNYFDYELKNKLQNYCRSLAGVEIENELKEWYKTNTGHCLNLDNPQRFTEKIQWMKLFGFGELETLLADKYLVRGWVKNKIGENYLIPLLGVWDTPESIKFEELPVSFVLKGNHGSQMNIIVKDKNAIDENSIRKTLDSWLNLNFAYCLGGFELQYDRIPRKIIAEKYMVDGTKTDLNDYKFHCFSGEPIYCEVICGRSGRKTIDYFDMEWNHQGFIDEAEDSNVKNSKEPVTRPVRFEEMIKIAKILCNGFPYVRVDLYQINNRVYFGEMTFTPSSGADIFTPDSTDYMLGEMFHLPNKRVFI